MASSHDARSRKINILLWIDSYAPAPLEQANPAHASSDLQRVLPPRTRLGSHDGLACFDLW